MERINLLLETVICELRRVTVIAEKPNLEISQEEIEARGRVVAELLLDAARKAEETRSYERIKRIAMILSGAVVQLEPVDADDVEEMMRVAMSLSDKDVLLLKELVRIMGVVVSKQGRIDRPNAYTAWQNGSWGYKG